MAWLCREGRSETGKETFARAIHGAGRRRKDPFVPVKRAAISDWPCFSSPPPVGYGAESLTGALNPIG